jgi:hypothetical protein
VPGCEGEAHSELEEPAIPGVTCLSLEHEAAVPNELVAAVPTVSETVANEVEAQSTEASIKQVLKHNVSGVLLADRSGGKLQAALQSADTHCNRLVVEHANDVVPKKHILGVETSG